jgi:hypothetical protein
MIGLALVYVHLLWYNPGGQARQVTAMRAGVWVGMWLGSNGAVMIRRKNWWPAAGAVIVAGATSIGGLVWHGELQADPPPAAPIAHAPSADAGQDARGVRIGLLGALGLALVGGAVTQCRTISRQGRAGEPLAWMAVEEGALPGADHGASAVEAPAGSGGEVTPLWPVAPALRLVDTRDDAGWASAQTPAEAQCTRAINAAHAYNRSGTVAAFIAALAADPDVKPSNLAGFWEMPSGGHADLARAYLRFGRRLDTRSVLTVAAMTFGPNRELESLQSELAGDDARQAGWSA